MRKRKPAASTAARQREILRATIEELARADYGGLSVERVAARAGVNKTTVYRQWPTKAQLVRAALESYAEIRRFGASTGALRDDLIRLGRLMLEFASSFEGQGLIRLRLLDHPEPELAEMARALNERHTAELVAVLRESVDRGELSAEVDPRLLLEMLGGALHVRMFVKSERVDDVIIARIVDMLLHGVMLQPRPDRRPRRTTASTRAVSSGGLTMRRGR